MSCKWKKESFKSDGAPQPIGPYSAGMKAGKFIFTSGQIGIDPKTGNIVEGGVVAETRQVMKNIAALLKEAGTDFDKVVKTTVFLRDMQDFSAMNAVYAEHFTAEPPARSTVAVAGLPKGAMVEIETVALLPCDHEHED